MGEKKVPLTSYVRRFHDVQKRLLLDRAGTKLVDLSNRSQKDVEAARRAGKVSDSKSGALKFAAQPITREVERLRGLFLRCGEIQNQLTELCSAAGTGERAADASDGYLPPPALPR